MFSFNVDRPDVSGRRRSAKVRRRRDRRGPGGPRHRPLPRPAGQRFVIVDAADSVGAAWRDRWDSLLLFTPRRYDSLPGLAVSGRPRRLPDAGRGDRLPGASTRRPSICPIELDSPVRSVSTNDGDGSSLELGDRTIEADQVVVATGPFQNPRVPAFAGELAPEVFQTHSTGYRRPSGRTRGHAFWSSAAATPGSRSRRSSSATHRVHLVGRLASDAAPAETPRP